MTPFLQTSRWHDQPPPSCNLTQKFWLQRPGPLTLGLRALGEFQLDVVFEGAQAVRHEDLACFGRGTVWCREVMMSIDGEPAVVARSLTPLRASHADWQGMRRLMRRPLADILYHDASIVRSSFEIARIGRHHGLWRSVQRSGVSLENGAALLARRSNFWRNGQPLMVSECFVPSFWQRVAGDDTASLVAI